MPRKKRYFYSEIEYFREQLEIKQIRTKNHFVIAILFFLLCLTMLYMILGKYPFSEIAPVLVGFLALLILNFAHLAFGKENHRFYQMNMYITTLGVFSLIVGMIFLFKSPSVITALFLAYAISVFYQDIKVLLLSDVYLLFTAVMLMLRFPEFFAFLNISNENRVGTLFFFLAFVIILSISSYIIVKQKRFFYNQIALSKEIEFRNIDLLMKMEDQSSKEEYPVENYYQNSFKFLQAFCKKIGTENVFEEKLHILSMLEKGDKLPTIQAIYPEYTLEDYERMQDLLIGSHQKLRKVAIKMSRLIELDVKRREMFSETHFKSFNHQSDSLEIKIIGFVLFYALLKRGMFSLNPVSEEKIYDILLSTDYYYYIHPKVLKIYKDNSAVFDEIVQDAFGKKVK